MITLDAFIARLERALVEVKPEIAVGLEKVGQLAESIAAELPGHYQPGWAPLAESTLKDKASKGFPVPSPLKRTGEMAGSYRKDVDPFNLAVDDLTQFAHLRQDRAQARRSFVDDLENASDFE
jgi:hypothetical protein